MQTENWYFKGTWRIGRNITIRVKVINVMSSLLAFVLIYFSSRRFLHEVLWQLCLPLEKKFWEIDNFPVGFCYQSKCKKGEFGEKSCGVILQRHPTGCLTGVMSTHPDTSEISLVKAEGSHAKTCPVFVKSYVTCNETRTQPFIIVLFSWDLLHLEIKKEFCLHWISSRLHFNNAPLSSAPP